ncbi:MAG: TetR/AcrR family transcriptional regulator [Spirochaetes bacterium]|nr:TetR/AcrR family transcriptional regulator [Spirochaetota bacterium]MBU0955754.1 TetR/AcrR family transcriptional regulator [Spirochaetota bacterium]
MTVLERIKEAAILEFDDKGVRFTMDDIARRLTISKKTLYIHIRDKEKLLEMIVDDAWKSIKEQEAEITSNPSIDSLQKFCSVVAIMPHFGVSVDYAKVRELEEQYPALKKRIEAHLDADWDITMGLYQEAVIAGLVRRIDIELLRQILYSYLSQLLGDDFLARTGRSYQAAVLDALDLLLDGLRIR